MGAKEDLKNIAKALTNSEVQDSLDQVAGLLTGTNKDEQSLKKTLATISKLAEQLHVFDRAGKVRKEVLQTCNLILETIEDTKPEDLTLDDINDVFGALLDELEEQVDDLIDQEGLRYAFGKRTLDDLDYLLADKKVQMKPNKILRKLALIVKMLKRRVEYK
jgi:hypothetical protein